jgi:ABC-2 type transport system ATP-binding protein
MSDAPANFFAIETRGLVKRFDGNEAVRGLDLRVPRGVMAGLVGPDGAGKSTAIRLLCGLLAPEAGAATVLGRDLFRDRTEIQRRVGYLSQEFTLYGDLTLDENIEFFARVHNVHPFRPRRDDLLEMTGLAPFRRRAAGRLSGGMKKKLALACTLIHTPELLLLDEPSTGVDPVARGEFWNLLGATVAQGMTVLLTTPYLDEAERCDRVCLMHGGRIVADGTPAELRAGVPGRMIQIDADDPVALYSRLRRTWPSDRLVLYGEHVRLWLNGGEADEREWRAALAREAPPPSWRRVEPNLEDALVAQVRATVPNGGPS